MNRNVTHFDWWDRWPKIIFSFLPLEMWGASGMEKCIYNMIEKAPTATPRSDYIHFLFHITHKHAHSFNGIAKLQS